MTPKARPVTGLVFVVVYDAVGQACDWLGFRCDWWRHRQGLWLLNGWAFASQFWFIVMFSDVNFSKQERNSFKWLSSNPNQPRQQKNFSLLADVFLVITFLAATRITLIVDFSSLLLSLAVISFHWSMWLSSSYSVWAREQTFLRCCCRWQWFCSTDRCD